MVGSMKELVRNIFRKFGIDIHKLGPTSNARYQIFQGLQRHGVNLVFDIGANTGQFARGIHAIGYRGDIVSFEPLSDAHAILSQSSAGIETWQVHERGAIGDFDGEIQINVAGNSQSSSLLPMLEAHSSAALDSAYIASEITPIRTLDKVAPRYISENTNMFIKIDTQGFEWQVLDGGPKTVKDARGILLELSLVPLYEGQRLWRDLIDRLESDGFTLWAIQPGFIDPRSGRTLQVDALFLRE